MWKRQYCLERNIDLRQKLAFVFFPLTTRVWGYSLSLPGLVEQILALNQNSTQNKEIKQKPSFLNSNQEPIQDCSLFHILLPQYIFLNPFGFRNHPYRIFLVKRVKREVSLCLKPTMQTTPEEAYYHFYASNFAYLIATTSSLLSVNQLPAI